LLILIATDGVPTNENGQQDKKSLEYVLRHERKPISHIPVTIIACTGTKTINKKISIEFSCLFFSLNIR
jgi:hypothetical protein